MVLVIRSDRPPPSSGVDYLSLCIKIVSSIPNHTSYVSPFTFARDYYLSSIIEKRRGKQAAKEGKHSTILLGTACLHHQHSIRSIHGLNTCIKLRHKIRIAHHCSDAGSSLLTLGFLSSIIIISLTRMVQEYFLPHTNLLVLTRGLRRFQTFVIVSVFLPYSV